MGEHGHGPSIEPRAGAILEELLDPCGAATSVQNPVPNLGECGQGK
jgi:hypothetical protein